MKLETLLKPIKYLDENVILRQYTKLGQKINIDEGKKKYLICEALRWGYGGLSFLGVNSNGKLFGEVFNISSFWVLGLNDGRYNGEGIRGRFKEESNSSDLIVLDSKKEFYKKYNSIVRLPTFLFGVGLITKFGVDAVNSIKNKTSLESTSWYCLIDGIGHLSLASSMYLKETNPKLLDKVPLWKKAYESAKEKINSWLPSPSPIPGYAKIID